MSTLEGQIDLRNILNRPYTRRTLGPTLDEQAKEAEAHWLQRRSRANRVPWKSPGACARCLAREESGSVTNFPYAFLTLGTLAAGFGAFLCGTFIASEWVAVSGFLTTLAGGLFYGWSLEA